VASSKNATKAIVEETKDAVKATPPGNAAVVAGAAPVPGKKSLGPKDPPPFLWKLVGRSGHSILTLFKAAEREDADAQLARLSREGYYKDLQILDINAAVKQPKQPRQPAPPKKPARASTPKRPTAAKRVVRQPVIALPRVKKVAVAAATKKKTTKSSPARKSSGKKAASRKPPAKKSPARKAIKKKK